MGISLKRFTQSNLPNHDDVFGILLQLPGKNGELFDPTFLISQAHRSDIIVTACIDPLAQVLIKPISEFGVDVAGVVCKDLVFQWVLVGPMQHILPAAKNIKG